MNPNFPNSSGAPSQVAALRRTLLPLVFWAALTSGTTHAQEAPSAPPEPAPHSAAIQPPQESQQPINPHTHLRQGNPVVYQSFRPCRIVDTRNSDAPFGGPKLVAGATRNFNLVPSGGACGDTLPAGATALAINVTITQTENEGFLTVWPGGQAQPLVSVINWTSSGTTIANAIIVPVGTDGSINVFSHQATHLLLDISGYYLSTLEAGDQLSIVGNNSTAALAGVNTGTGAGVRGESVSGPAGYFAGNAVVTGNLGVGTETLTSKLTVAGVIESSTGGVKFPDGTVQTSAATGGGTGNFIQNTTTQQAGANFNIEGNGTAGGALSASVVNSATQYNIGGQRVLSTGPLGTANLFVGFDAGAVTTACCNAFVGNEAGRFNTSGSANAFFGNQAGLNNTTASANAFFGNRAGFSNTTGTDNAFFGTLAGTNNTASNNSFFGARAGLRNTTGSANTFFGMEAGRENTTGQWNTFVGFYAGQSNTTGHSNAFFGLQAGRRNTSSDNAFFGAFAGDSNTTGHSNAFVGTGAGYYNTTGNFLTFVGRNAGFVNTTGNENVFFGYAAGQTNTTASYNAFFGVRAGFINTTGQYNTFVGHTAGESNTTGGGNTFVGQHAGTNNTMGTNNTVIGAGTNVASGDLSYATAIGAGAVVSTSNTVVLGRAVDTVSVPGTLTKAAGTFRIDHPLDPENRTLSHSFVESPDMMNIYNGVVTLDRRGRAVVTLPSYFEALNRDFRYQLTAIGAPAPNLHVAREVSGSRFHIAGGRTGMRVSWQVTGVRQDAYANANRVRVEEDKTPAERGTLLHPEAFGAGAGRRAQRVRR